MKVDVKQIGRLNGNMIKILLLADIHGNAAAAAGAAAANPDADAVIAAGDITNFGDEDSATAVIEGLKSVLPGRPIFAVAGNCDPLRVRKYLSRAGLDIENASRMLDDYSVVGAGGGLYRAGITSYERSEDELAAALTPAFLALRSNNTNRSAIVVTHTPPYGTNGDENHGRHVGSKEFAALMVEYNPMVWVCGHIHESRCVSVEDGTLVVNPGPCGAGFYAVLEIENKTGARYPRARLYP